MKAMGSQVRVFPVHRIDPDVVVLGQGAGLGDDRIGDGLHVGQPVEAGREILDRPHAGRLVGHGPIQPCVGDGHCGLVGERLRQPQLVVRPLAVARVIEADDAHRADRC